MKKIILIAVVLFFVVHAYPQPDPLKRVKAKVEKRIDDKNKKQDDGADSSTGKEQKAPEENNKAKESVTGQASSDSTPANPASFKAYSKYDFIPGEKVIGFEDFSTGNIGDFPAGWNTSGSGEIVTVEGKPGRWLWISKPGVFVPEFTNKYPDDFTFEFDLLHGIPINSSQFKVVLAQLENVTQPQNFSLAPNRFTAGLFTANTGQKEGTAWNDIRKNSVSVSSNQFDTELLSDKNNPVHISIWRQKERIRIYCNQEKIWDVPKAIAPEAKLNAIVFTVLYAEDKIQHYIGNIRLAVGAPDARNKMLTQKKWVTHGILFDVNSANIKPESYGTLKEMAAVLKENTDMKIKIIGHTDGDGNDAGNLDLSKRRAASVKDALAKEFGVDENRMQTDGKGEGEPIDKNDSPAGKANNRRVEFIKM